MNSGIKKNNRNSIKYRPITFDSAKKMSTYLQDVGDDKVTPKSLKEYLGNIQEVLNDKNRTFEVLEWRATALMALL